MRSLVDDVAINVSSQIVQLTPKDFKADIEVRWCAGCGGYSILAQVQRIMPGLGIPKEKIAFVSGIGCSSRFPYYMDVYGFHSIHGRALAVASGLKVSRPDLSVWVVTGDGDCMSIGGNHFIHALRRNVDLNILMFNNEIYSLTKGQYSPTSRPGQKTKTSPFGVIDNPFNPSALALGAGATFVSRGYDKDPKMLQYLFERSAAHKGVAFNELYANCVIFNDGAFDSYTEKEHRAETTVWMEHGKPLIFGAKNDKGVILDGYTPKVVSLADGSYSANDLLVHNEKDTTLALILANMTHDESLPRPMGVFQCLDLPSYETQMQDQINDLVATKGEGDLLQLLKGGDYWEIV